MQKPLLTLDTLPPGSNAKIVSISGSGGWVYRLYQMGLTPGTIVTVIVNYGAGPLVVRVRGVDISLGRGIARRIIVEPL